MAKYNALTITYGEKITLSEALLAMASLEELKERSKTGLVPLSKLSNVIGNSCLIYDDKRIIKGITGDFYPIVLDFADDDTTDSYWDRRTVMNAEIGVPVDNRDCIYVTFYDHNAVTNQPHIERIVIHNGHMSVDRNITAANCRDEFCVAKPVNVV